MKILGIDTSCDDTAIGIIDTNKRAILCNYRFSQNHNNFGGVVPELAARQHLEQIKLATLKALEISGLQLSDIDLFAATAGPGLIAGLIVGYYFAMTMAKGLNKPFKAINHLEAHLSACYGFDVVQKPFLALIISGGHSAIYKVSNQYTLLSETVDDAAGEIIDKVGRAIGLNFPAGRELELLALSYSGEQEELLPVMKGKLGMSFSGLKTKYLNLVGVWSNSKLAWHLLNHIAITLFEKFQIVLKDNPTENIYICGGVAANSIIRNKLCCLPAKIHYPPIELCTDNGVMVAFAAYHGNVINVKDVFARSLL